MSTEIEPAVPERPSLREWLEQFLPFHLPHVPLSQTAKNLDLALARILVAAGENASIRIERSTKSIAALGSAEKTAIEASAKIAAKHIAAGSSLSERALEYTYRDSILKQENREKIAGRACEEIAQNPPSQDAEKQIDHDWLNHFSRHAENVSSDDVQSLWAKILAGEIRRPGTFKIRTLQELSVLSRDEAEAIHRILHYAIDKEFIFKTRHTTVSCIARTYGMRGVGCYFGN
jgi:hypothetical protein